MKPVLYLVLALFLVPMQVTVLHSANLAGVHPDVGLVAICLVGLFGGELEGLLLGCVLGFSQDLFSAGGLWLNLATKAAAGFLAGLVGRHIAHMTPAVLFGGVLIISCLSGLMMLWSSKLQTPEDLGLATYAILLPQALFDALLAMGLYWLMERRLFMDRMSLTHRY